MLTYGNVPLIVKNSPFRNKTEITNLNTMKITMDQNPVEQKRSGIVVVGSDSSLNYLLGRYAELIGCAISFEKSILSAEAIRRSEPVAVIFPSVEILAGAQTLVSELTNCEIPIIVCSSVLDQAKTRELGADYYLLHPLGFDGFSSTMQAITTSQREKHPIHRDGQDSLPINPV